MSRCHQSATFCLAAHSLIPPWMRVRLVSIIVQPMQWTLNYNWWLWTLRTTTGAGPPALTRYNTQRTWIHKRNTMTTTSSWPHPIHPTVRSSGRSSVCSHLSAGMSEEFLYYSHSLRIGSNVQAFSAIKPFSLEQGHVQKVNLVSGAFQGELDGVWFRCSRATELQS